MIYLILYAIIMVPSWFFICGCNFAHLQRGYPILAQRERDLDKLMAFQLANIGCFIWFIAVPVTYFSDYRKFGWSMNFKNGALKNAH
jgi:hypothetical protein